MRPRHVHRRLEGLATHKLGTIPPAKIRVRRQCITNGNVNTVVGL